MIAKTAAILGQVISYTGLRPYILGKMGVALTVGILGVITVASFAIWLIPQQNIGTQIIISDYSGHLDGIDDQRRAITGAISERITQVIGGEISPADHIESARESSVIVKRQIAELLRSGADESWHASYRAYVESLRSLDAYISESIVISGLVESGDSIEDNVAAMDSSLEASAEYAAQSLVARP